MVPKILPAVRKPDGTIVLEMEELKNISERFPFLKWPLIRGTFVLIDSMVLGIRMLNMSANMSMDEDEEELTGNGNIFYRFVGLCFSYSTICGSLPTAIVHFTSQFLGGVVLQNIVEGIIRITFFLLYVYFISKMEEIDRVFMYHGAEHKSISAYEAGEDLTVENARKFSTLYIPVAEPVFLLIVMVISIFVFAMLGEGDLFYRVWSRLAVLPIVAGLGYEFIKLSGKYYGRKWANFLIAPGLVLQKLTTREPDDSQLEVAITAL